MQRKETIVGGILWTVIYMPQVSGPEDISIVCVPPSQGDSKALLRSSSYADQARNRCSSGPL